jgi:hypothetical protein
MNPTTPSVNDTKKKTVKAWAILDVVSGTLQRYQSGEYMIQATITKRKYLHETYISVPCTITYSI